MLGSSSALAVLLSLALAAGAWAEELVVEDLASRKVSVRLPVERVLAVGPGALRLLCYLGLQDKVVGIEDLEAEGARVMGRPYRMASPELGGRPVFGKGGPNPSPDLERMASLSPQVIFLVGDPGLADSIQGKLGVPVLVLSYGGFGFADEPLWRSLRLVGEVMGVRERAEGLISYAKGLMDDLRRRGESVPEGARPSVYAGGISSRGGHGISMTSYPFPPLDLLGARNVAAGAGRRGTFAVDVEKLFEWDPEVVFLDVGNLELVKADLAKFPALKGLRAFREGRVFALVQYNFYNTNLELALINAYAVGKVLYPQAFADVDLPSKAGEILRRFVGKDVYGELLSGYGEPGRRLEL